MKPTNKIAALQNIARSLFLGSAVLFLAVVATFALWYISSGYTTLVSWFYALNGCFYKSGEWTTFFFTPQVKAVGNLYAAAAVVICVSGIVYIACRRQNYFSVREPGQSIIAVKGTGLWYIPVVIAGVCSWFWGHGMVKPGADEIFSAVNCAELPPFQTLAYYMLPNNHIYFNFINGYLAKWSGADAVQTGRVLSMLAYVGALCCAFHWCSRLFRQRVWAFVALLPLVFQFTGWAFSFQARGYECQLLCGWVTFLALFSYTGNAAVSALRAFTLFSIIGFALVPSYLSFYLAQVIFALLLQAYGRRIDIRFWKYLFICIAVVFLLYLPALCFSGREALTGNSYVKSPDISLRVFIPQWFEVFKYFINFIFAFMIRENHPLSFLLFVLPLALFFFKDKYRKRLGLFYVTLWAVWALVCFFMERYPFSRNMIVHYGLSAAIIIYTLWSIIEALLFGIKKQVWKNTIKAFAFGLPLLIFTIHSVVWGKENVLS